MLIGRLRAGAFVSRLMGSRYGGLRLLRPGRNSAVELLVSRDASSTRISKNISLLRREPELLVCQRPLASPRSPAESEGAEGAEKERNLVAMFTWLQSKPKHVMKYANLYLNQGFDVVTVSLTPLQLLWPQSGSKIVASELLSFLLERECYRKILLHGFSVGGYLWGEALNLMESDREKYDGVIDRIVGQVWDSIADTTEISIGVPRALFPTRIWLQRLLKNSLEFHMWFFHEQSTRHYLRSKEAFHRSVVRAPGLYFLSKTDPVGTVNSNLELTDAWESIGIETTIKIFESSPHVGHFLMYPEEYTAELYSFLAKLDLLRSNAKLSVAD